MTISFESFLTLPVEDVADLVRKHGPRVCVFPINGTRRWFVLEYPEQAAGDYMAAYLDIAGRRHLELYQLFFDHGIETLLTPIFGPDLFTRGNAYDVMLEQGLVWFAQHPDFLTFYEAYDVRTRIYGDAHGYLDGTVYASALADYEALTERTAHHSRHRLFFGVCAHDAAESIARIGHEFYKAHGRLPSKEEIVAAYYGEMVGPVDLFIGFDRPAAFDMPLIATGQEDLYFTVAPSPYMDIVTLRAILYDHMFARRIDDADYEALAPADWATMAAFYRDNRHSVLGLGRQGLKGHFWYPTPQVQLSSDLAGE